uniref:Putative secreted protein n=1 Tax=Amblyomma tuberculatum TaxID=48802 RepID=A0A6M2E451_9ACAR
MFHEEVFICFLLMFIVHGENDAITSIGQLSLEELRQYQDPSQMLAKQEIIVLLRASPPWGTTFSTCLKSRYKWKTEKRFQRTVEYYDTQGLRHTSTVGTTLRNFTVNIKVVENKGQQTKITVKQNTSKNTESAMSEAETDYTVLMGDYSAKESRGRLATEL